MVNGNAVAESFGGTGSKAPKGPANDVRITYLVKQLELAIRSELDLMTRDFDLTTMQYTALSVLQRHPGMSSAQLARRSFVSAQAGNVMIAVLERKGLIIRKSDENNRRILRISLTKAGETLLRRCDRHVQKIEARMLSTLTPAEGTVLGLELAACVRSLKPHTGR
jgi:DNA-binding MarR family transcriptional regulator